MADDITDTISTVPKMPEIPPRKSDRYAIRVGNDGYICWWHNETVSYVFCYIG
jgi:hypothetical protein